MQTLRKANDRFHTNIDWLDSYHSFSFGEHYDPKHMGFGPLRVINDDRIAGGGGFPRHPHRDMEIITVVLKGSLSHQDSLGTGSTIAPGDVQKMSAGRGILHSEFNASKTDPVHLLQIWIQPSVTGIAPSYQQIHFAREQWRNRFCRVAGPDASGDIIFLNQDAAIEIADISQGTTLTQAIAPGRNVWAHLATGKATINGAAMSAGDALALDNESSLTCTAQEESTLLLFDLAA